MRAVIVSTGRFHVLDLARELAALGHEIFFYSIVPTQRTERFGLPRQCSRSLFSVLSPLVGPAHMIRPGRIRDWLNRKIMVAVDELVARTMPKCDVFIGMSGVCVESAKRARDKHGAAVLIERGSRHILSQKEILDSIYPGRKSQVYPVDVKRELASYEAADAIVVGSEHARQSFLERGFSEATLFRNTYGVDLEMFPPTEMPEADPPRVVMAGAWSSQKGCDVLVDAYKQMTVPAELIHVGPVKDLPLPTCPGFTHHDAVDQWKLKDIYAQSHVFALASRQEGLALVQPQALACGLSLVCTDRTGGADLVDFVDDPAVIHVVANEDAAALSSALDEAVQQVGKEPVGTLRDRLGDRRHDLSWPMYASRYEQFLLQRFGSQ